MNLEEKNANRSIRRTKRILKENFVELVKEKGYKNMTVTDIVERADYNRSTFYLYFRDKDDLAEELVRETLEDLLSAFYQPFSGSKIIVYKSIMPNSNTFFQHFYTHRKVYQLLSIQNSIPRFQEKFLMKFKEIFDGLMYINGDNEEIHIEHFNTYKMYGSYGVILEWIESGCVKSADEIADNLLEIFKTSSSSFKFK